MEIAVQMCNITMKFGPVVANDQVDFEVRKGEIHALIGENGAGKTTLMNILYGLYVPTAGHIKIFGKEQKFYSAIDAIKAGIGMVHQHFMLVPSLTVADNIVLGSEPRKGSIYQRNQAIEEIRALCDEYEMKLDPKAMVSEVSLGTQQRIEIMKALYRKAEIIILDEPTAVLTPQEIEELGIMLKKLKAMGKTIIIITHKLKEIIDYSDRVTVLRKGKMVATVNTSETSADEITKMMVGRSVHLGGNKVETQKETEVLKIENLYYHNGKVHKLKNVSLSVKSGEILGIAGIDNSGQRELTEIIAGILPPEKGTVILDGVDITNRQVQDIKKRGVGFIPQDRQKSGLALNMSVGENLMLGYQSKPSYQSLKGLLNPVGMQEDFKKMIGEYDIRPGYVDAAARTLSGGNQQKIVVAREVSNASRLIIADQPSRGVDVGATELIHQKLVAARNKNMAVLLVSLELDEVMMLSDRIAVMYDGEIMGIIDAASATRELLGQMMVGVRLEGGGKVENE